MTNRQPRGTESEHQPGSSANQAARAPGLQCGRRGGRERPRRLGDAGAAITGGGLAISEVGNVIVSNLSFDDWDDDAICVQDGSTNVWIDHNTFGTGYDGTLDTKSGSDYVTVSWNVFNGQDKNMLVGHSDDNGGEGDSEPGRLVEMDNVLDGSGEILTAGSVDTALPYSYTADPADQIPGIVGEGAGAA